MNNLFVSYNNAALYCAILFVGMVGFYASLQINVTFIIVASMLGGYMALNIGANDVANNVGPAVGSKALTLTGALIIAAIFESAGAVIGGGDVISTISKSIIDPTLMPDSSTFAWVMMSTLLSSALWINFATYVGAPVSTTHAVVGGVLGAGVAAVGFSVVNWDVVSKIMASWIISPVLGGIIAALFLALIKINIIHQADKIKSARCWVPVLVALMISVFAYYLIMKGLKHIWEPDTFTVAVASLGLFFTSWVILKPIIAQQSQGLKNRRQSLYGLFRLPLIGSIAMLSFAHGSNDVANAVAPLAAIIHSFETGDIAAEVGIPSWVIIIGAVGISLGLFLFGARLIRVVGQEITTLNPISAFCVSLAAAITVIIASGFGLPVSSTHIAVGAIFGVGLLREYFNSRKLIRRKYCLTIITAWLITVPTTAALSAGVFYTLNYLR